MAARETLRTVFTTLLLALILPPSGSHAGSFADQVIAFSPGGDDLGCGVIVNFDVCSGDPLPFTLSLALGAPDHRYVTVGELGSIALGFSGQVITDEPGDDFTVWGSCNAFREPGSVWVSADGATFQEIGIFDSGVSTSFDLADLALPSASVVRLVDLPGGVGLPWGLAFDVDALEALHLGGAVPAQGATWGRVKATYR
jgi:hypothetical protein